MTLGLEAKTALRCYLFSLSARPRSEVGLPAAKRGGRHFTTAGRQAHPRREHTHFPPLAVFKYRFPGSLPARLIRPRSSLQLYYPPLLLLRRPRCQPGQVAVRDSHVIPQRQTHDLRYGVSRSRHRIRFMACATFGLRCSRASAYQPDLSSTHHARRRISKGLYSDGGLTPPSTGLSYPETHAFPRGAEQSRFPLVPLSHFCDLISPPAEPG